MFQNYEVFAYLFFPFFVFSQKDSLEISIENGRLLYDDFCVRCHLPNGKGEIGIIPPLAESDFLYKHMEESIKALKFGGIDGEIIVNGVKYNSRMEKMGLYDDEIVPMDTVMKLVNKESGEEKDVEVTVDKDDCNRPETTIEGLQSLKPVFDPENGSVTAGNSSQLSDGASVTLVMSEDKAKELGLTPKLYFRGFTVVGCQPDEMGIGPVYSIPKLLKSAGLSIEDIDLWELNEAFASQVVYIRDQLKLPSDKLNVNGGSISIGHPFGMTGSRQVGHLARELNRRDGKYGIVTMCVGGGMGATGLFEAYKA